MICEKCFYEVDEKDFTDTDRIERHHNPPKFMMEKWKGDIIDLCNYCHIEILHLIILNIIKKHANLLSNKNNSAQWIWKYYIIPGEKEACIKEVVEKTKEWLKEEKEDDTKTTTEP